MIGSSVLPLAGGSPPTGSFREQLAALLGVLLVMTLSPNSTAFCVQLWTGITLAPAIPIAAACAVIAIFLIASEPINRFELWVLILSGAMIGYFCVTGLWSPSHEYLQQKMLYSLTLEPTMLIGVVIGRSDERVRRFSLALVAFGVFLCLTAIVFGIGVVSEYDDFDTSSVRAGYQGVSRMLALSIAGAVILLRRPWASNTVRVALIGCSVMFFAVLMQSGGRTGLAALIGFALLLLFFQGTTSVRIGVVIASVLGAAILQSGAVSNWAESAWLDDDLPFTIRRFAFYMSSLGESHQLEQSRGFFHELAIGQFLEQPVFGVGWGGFPIYGGYGDVDYIYPHNMIYEIAAETGIVGIGLLALVLLTVLSKAIQVDRRFHFQGNVMGLFGAGFTIAMVVSDFSTQREFMLFLGMLAAVSVRLYNRTSVTPKYAATD